MVLLLIDDSILDNDIINDKFFTNNNIIPLNTDIGIIKVPYYYNSKHYYRDLSINNQIKYEDMMEIKLKPVNYAKYASISFYNPNASNGDIISHEYIPTKMRKYNIAPESIIIKRIVVWTNNTYLSTSPFMNILYNDSPLNSVKINFITFSVDNKQYFKEYILLPKKDKKIPIKDNTFLDVANIIPLKIKDIKFVIECLII